MKAVIIEGFGGIDKLQLENVAEPKVARRSTGSHAATSVNPIDWKIRSLGPHGGASMFSCLRSWDAIWPARSMRSEKE